MKVVSRLRLTPTCSRGIVVACGIGGTITAGLMCALPMPHWALAGALGWCVGITLAAVRRALRCGPTSVVIGADRRVTVTDRRGITRDGDVRDATYVSGALIALVWRADGARWSSAWVIPPDVLTGEERRQMRVLLRYGRSATAVNRAS